MPLKARRPQKNASKYKLVAEITKNRYFDQNIEKKIVCYATAAQLVAPLEQFFWEESLYISYASRFLTSHVKENSTAESELQGVVWSVEHFKNYV